MFHERIELQALLYVAVDILVDIALDKRGSVSIAWMVEVVLVMIIFLGEVGV